jgi:serine O-acetyltransferase
MFEWKKLRQLNHCDSYRYYGKETIGIIRRHLIVPRALRHLRYIRACQCATNSFSLLLSRFLLRISSNRTHIQIPYQTSIGPGFYIGHFGRIVIHPESVIGANVNIGTGTTIGSIPFGKYEGTPVIKDRVWIGTNVVIVGRITIGEDSIIGPNCFVNRDVPPGSTLQSGSFICKPRTQPMTAYLGNIADSHINE